MWLVYVTGIASNPYMYYCGALTTRFSDAPLSLFIEIKYNKIKYSIMFQVTNKAMKDKLTI